MSEPTPSNKEDKDFQEIVERAIEGTGFEIATPDELTAYIAGGLQAVNDHDERAKVEGRRFLDEEHDREIIETWWAEAKACKSIEAAAEFAQRLITDYRHDYGTICHAIAAGAIAMAWGIEQSPEGGITGFQAGAVGWMLHAKWSDWPKGPRRITDYSDLLYPQSDYKFTTISPDTAEWLKKRAAERMSESPNAHPDVVARWRLIASGELPPFMTVEVS